MTTQPGQTSEYSQHFARLKQIARKLEQAGEDVDIDQLVADVKSAMESYEHCKGRIEAARKELARYVENNQQA